MYSFGYFPGVWLLYADVSEPSIGSIFKGLKMEPIEGSKTSAYNNQTPGKHPKEYIIDSKHGEGLKSRIISCCLYFVLHVLPPIGWRLKPTASFTLPVFSQYLKKRKDPKFGNIFGIKYFSWIQFYLRNKSTKYIGWQDFYVTET